MDADQFDTLTRSLSSAGSRRRLLGSALSGTLLALLALRLADPDQASAARSAKCRRKPGECERCDRGTCRKHHGKKRCTAGKIKAKPFGTPCSQGTCQNGACIAAAPASPACPQGFTNCNGVCRNLTVEKAHCGACGRACSGTNQVCCSGLCHNLNRDPTNCGACGTSCAGGECCRGTCCAVGQTCSFGVCVASP